MEPLARDASHWVELRPRIISSLVLIAIVGTAVWAGGVWFNALIMLAALQMIREWDRLTEIFASGWRLFGLAYVAIPCLSLIWLRGLSFKDMSKPIEDMSANLPNDVHGMITVFYLICVIAATDVGAFFFGRHIGGPRLAPVLSPNKTWAGLLGGMLSAATISAVFSTFAPFPDKIFPAIAMGLILATFAQGGDLFESWLKRKADIKDSGTLIPGHGGILDRVDGYIITAPTLVIFIYAFGSELL